MTSSLERARVLEARPQWKGAAGRYEMASVIKVGLLFCTSALFSPWVGVFLCYTYSMPFYLLVMLQACLPGLPADVTVIVKRGDGRLTVQLVIQSQPPGTRLAQPVHISSWPMMKEKQHCKRAPEPKRRGLIANRPDEGYCISQVPLRQSHLRLQRYSVAIANSG